MLAVGLAGDRGGRLAELAERGVLDYLFVVPSSSVHRIQEAQTTVYHVLRELTRARARPEPTPRGHSPGEEERIRADPPTFTFLDIDEDGEAA